MPAVASQSETLVLSWKTLVEEDASLHRAAAGGAASDRCGAGWRSGNARCSSEGISQSRLNDELSNGRGRVEPRPRKPDAHAALTPATGSHAGCSDGSSHGDGGACERSRREALTSKLRARYRDLDKVKRAKEIVKLDVVPTHLNTKRTAHSHAGASARPDTSLRQRFK